MNIHAIKYPFALPFVIVAYLATDRRCVSDELFYPASDSELSYSPTSYRSFFWTLVFNNVRLNLYTEGLGEIK